MRCLRIVRLPILAVLVLVTLLYLVVSVVGLFSIVTVAKAGTAPSGSFHMVQIADNELDYVYNWDFNSQSTSYDNVDWAMRFLFAGSVVDVDYVKDRLDGYNNDPSITPVVASSGLGKNAYLYDGDEQSGTRWDSDGGIKNYPGCTWNYGHMRVYAQTGEDHNYDPDFGNYVVASNHVDKEDPPRWYWCDERFRSVESDETVWRNRISGYLTGSPYQWSIGSDFNWNNWGYGNLTQGNHQYGSDGYGRVINVGQTD